jgi:hypothetical protein
MHANTPRVSTHVHTPQQSFRANVPTLESGVAVSHFGRSSFSFPACRRYAPSTRLSVACSDKRTDLASSIVSSAGNSGNHLQRLAQDTILSEIMDTREAAKDRLAKPLAPPAAPPGAAILQSTPLIDQRIRELQEGLDPNLPFNIPESPNRKYQIPEHCHATHCRTQHCLSTY